MQFANSLILSLVVSNLFNAFVLGVFYLRIFVSTLLTVVVVLHITLQTTGGGRGASQFNTLDDELTKKQSENLVYIYNYISKLM